MPVKEANPQTRADDTLNDHKKQREMKTVYFLYKCDSWHSYDSMELVFVGSSIEKCYWAAHWKGATDEQVKQLKDIRQSQCTENRNYEFYIECYDVDRLN